MNLLKYLTFSNKKYYILLRIIYHYDNESIIHILTVLDKIPDINDINKFYKKEINYNDGYYFISINNYPKRYKKQLQNILSEEKCNKCTLFKIFCCCEEDPNRKILVYIGGYHAPQYIKICKEIPPNFEKERHFTENIIEDDYNIWKGRYCIKCNNIKKCNNDCDQNFEDIYSISEYLYCDFFNKSTPVFISPKNYDSDPDSD